MRSRHILYSLCAAAPLAMAAPASPHVVLVKTLEDKVSDPSSGPLGYQPPATITTAGAAGSKTEILRPLDRQSVMDGQAAREPAFDNRPLSASASDLSRLASEVLSSAGPLSSDLLAALARLQAAEDSSQGETETEAEAETNTQSVAGSQREPSSRRKMSVGSLVRLASNRDGGVLRIKQHAEAHAANLTALGGAHQLHPCAAHHGDGLVIGVVLTFLLVVLMMETWQPASRTVRRILRREGCIRLQDDVEAVRATPVRAPGLQVPEMRDEKQQEEYDDEDDEGGAEPWVI